MTRHRTAWDGQPFAGVGRRVGSTPEVNPFPEQYTPGPTLCVSVEQVYGRPHVGATGTVLQARGRVGDERQAYNVQVAVSNRPLSIPRWILVRRSSWAGKHGDGGSLPI